MPDIICQHCGSINDYSSIMKSNQLTAWCNGCDKFIKNISQGKTPQLYFGKYIGREIASMTSAEELRYLKWLSDQPMCKNLLKSQIETHLKSI
jgi:hypothetical protein